MTHKRQVANSLLKHEFFKDKNLEPFIPSSAFNLYLEGRFYHDMLYCTKLATLLNYTSQTLDFVPIATGMGTLNLNADLSRGVFIVVI